MSDSSDQHLVLAFLERFRADRVAKKEVGLAEYVALFPGHDELIAREYLGALAGIRGDAEPAMTPNDSGDGSDHIGPYRLNQELGRGGQGVVWLAEDVRLGRRVALKVLSGLGPGAEEHLVRFKREAALASKLEHPGICGVYDAGIEGGVPYIAMRYVKGETLADRLSSLRSATTEGALSSFILFDDGEEVSEAPASLTNPSGSSSIDREELDRIITTSEKIATAMHAAHEVGIVHRGIKPGNIMVTESDHQPIILDFGLARDDSDEAGPSLTQTGDVFGTPAYMSPEQITGRRVRIDRRTDIYSLGATLYECLTMKRPFQAPTRESLYQAILSEEPESPRKLNRLIPRDLEVVLQCAMDKDRDRRYQTASDLAEDLRRVGAGEPILAKKVFAVGRAWRWSKRRPAAAALLMALALGIPTISGLGVWWWTHRDDVAAQKQARIDELVEDQLEIGFFELDHGTAEEAVAAFEEALRSDQRSAEAVAGLTLAFLRLDDAEAALRVVQRGEEAVEQPGILARAKARVLRELGREAEASSLWENAPEIAGPLMWFLEGLSLIDRGHDLEEGTAARTAAFEQAASALRCAVASSPRPRRAYHFQLAIAWGRLSDATGSKVSAKVIENLWPKSALGRFWSGFATNRTDLDRSIAAYRSSIRLDPNYAAAHHNLGNALKEQGHLHEAVAAYREAIRLAPEYAEAYVNLGQALSDQGRHDEAVASCREAIRLDPGLALAHFNLAGALKNQGHLDTAAAAYREAIRLDPYRTTTHYNLGVTLGDQGHFEEAAAAYREVIRIDPEHAEAYCNLGNLLRRELGQLAEGLRVLRKGHDLGLERGGAWRNPSDAWLQNAVVARARELRNEGDLEGAVALLVEYTQAYPDLEELPRILEQARRRLESEADR